MGAGEAGGGVLVGSALALLPPPPLLPRLRADQAPFPPACHTTAALCASPSSSHPPAPRERTMS